MALGLGPYNNSTLPKGKKNPFFPPFDPTPSCMLSQIIHPSTQTLFSFCHFLLLGLPIWEPI